VRVWLDECVDWRLGRELASHDVKTARQMGLTALNNGELLALASAQFDVFVTVDRNLSFQQDIVSFPIAVAALGSHLATCRARIPCELGPCGRRRQPRGGGPAPVGISWRLRELTHRAPTDYALPI
jgi:hypothetical protein